MTTPNQQFRFTVLDSWRGIASILVALFHLQALGHIYGLPFLRNSYLFVDFFFVLSGFVITHAYLDKLGSWGEFASFVVRRFGRVWPLHMVVLGGFIAIETVKYLLTATVDNVGLAPFDPSGHTALSTIPSHVVLTQALGFLDKLTWNEPSWSISAEFWIYVVFGLVCVLCGGWRTVVLAVLGSAGVLTVVEYSTSGMDATFDLGFPRCVFGFVIGHLAYLAYRANQSSRTFDLGHSWVPEALSVLLVVAFVSVAGREPLSFAAPLLFAVPVFIFALESGPLSRLLLARPFQVLGQWSYSIYMVHGLVAFVLGLAVSWFQRRTGIQFWHEMDAGGGPTRVIIADKLLLDFLFAIYLITVLAISSLTYRWVEQPGRAFFGRLAGLFERTRPMAISAQCRL